MGDKLNLHRTIEEKFEAVKDISPAWDRVAHFSWNDLIGMRDKISALEAELQQARDDLSEARRLAQWTPITPDTLPKVGDRVMETKTVQGNDWTADDYHKNGYTHYRPIAPPEVKP